jgi:hypothetical protein
MGQRGLLGKERELMPVVMRNHGKLGRLEREKVWLTDAGRQLEMGVEAVQQNETARACLVSRQAPADSLELSAGS